MLDWYPLRLSVCVCSPWSYPGPPNYDAMISTQGSNTGTATWSASGASLVFWGAQPTLPNGIASMSNGSYYISVSQGTGAPVLAPANEAGNLPIALRDPTGTSVSVSWTPPLLSNSPENPLPYTPPNMGYTVRAVLFGGCPTGRILFV